VLQDFILRAVAPAKASLPFALGPDGKLAFPEQPAARIKVLRREVSGLITVLWGDQIVSGIVTSAGERGDTLNVMINGQTLTLTLREALVDSMEQGVAGAQRNGGTFDVASPIPGRVKAVAVQAGAAVTTGQTIIVLEAMKMENEIVAPHDGTVDTITVAAGQVVAAGALLAKLKLD
jgi:biotin carboxyl carrier protein